MHKNKPVDTHEINRDLSLSSQRFPQKMPV